MGIVGRRVLAIRDGKHFCLPCEATVLTDEKLLNKTIKHALSHGIPFVFLATTINTVFYIYHESIGLQFKSPPPLYRLGWRLLATTL